MADREKVVRALDCLSRNAQDAPCNGCAYFRPFTDDPDTGLCDRTTAMADALAMLREQEDERITTSEWLEDSDPGQEYGTTWACWVCGYSMHEPYVWNPIQAKMRYCPWCRRRMVGV